MPRSEACHFQPVLHSLEKGEGLQMESVMEHAYVTKPPHKHEKVGVRRASGLANIWRCGELGSYREGTEASCPFPPTLPYSSLQSGYSSVSFITSFCNNCRKQVKCFPSSVSYSSKLIKPGERVVGDSDL